MKIRTRLQVLTAASVALVVIISFLFYWSQHRLATANKAKNLADEIVSSVFERNALRNDYLNNGNQPAKGQWFLKQNQLSDLLKTAQTVSCANLSTFQNSPKQWRVSASTGWRSTNRRWSE